MADAGRNSTGAQDRLERQERRRQPVEPGALDGSMDEPKSAKEALNEANHEFGKTSGHVSGQIDEPPPHQTNQTT